MNHKMKLRPDNSIKDAIEQFKQHSHYKTLSYSSHLSYSLAFDHLESLIPFSTPICRLLERDFIDRVITWIDRENEHSDLAPSTRRKYKDLWAVFFKWLVLHDMLIKNPLAFVKNPKRNQSGGTKGIPPPQQLDAIQDVLYGEYRDAFIILRHFGRRYGEVCNNGKPSHNPPRYTGQTIIFYQGKTDADYLEYGIPSNHGIRDAIERNLQGDKVVFEFTYYDFWQALHFANKKVCSDDTTGTFHDRIHFHLLCKCWITDHYKWCKDPVQTALASGKSVQVVEKYYIQELRRQDDIQAFMAQR